MTPQDETRFVGALVALRAAMPNAPSVTPEMLGTYRAVLGDQPIDAIERAVETWMRSDSSFYPTAGQLFTLCTGRTENRAPLAWLDVTKEVRRVGYTGTPKLDAFAREVVDAVWGSWPRLCRTLPGEGAELIGWWKRFEAAYNALAERRTHAAYIGRDETRAVLGGLMRKIAAHRDRGQLPPREADR